MKPDADRSELLGQVIEMLLSDREKALSTGNITAAITASKTVADLLALRIQRAPEDEDSPIAMKDLDPRQIGRAILAILGEAKLDDAEGDGAAHAPMPPAKHMMTAQRFEEVDEVDALDLSDEPPVGERILVGDHGCWFEKTPDGRWRSMHADGTLHRYCKSRDEAERQASELTW
ncbi:hypothetical protein V3589_25430 [Sinorhizobium fredii]|uniref:hypothetical protein n=1 Tax=Rhizobium fredii TaxID=380 RepID=UPI0030A6273B